MACHGHEWRRSGHRTAAGEVEVNDILRGLFAECAVACVVLIFPDVVPTRTVIRVAARRNAAAKKCVSVGQKLRVIGRENGFVMRQSVANEFRGLQVFGINARFEECCVFWLNAPEMDERTQIHARRARKPQNPAVHVGQTVARRLGDEVQILFSVKRINHFPAIKGSHFDVFGVAALLVTDFVFGRAGNIHWVSGAEIWRDHPVQRRLVAGDLRIVAERFAERGVNVYLVKPVENRRRWHIDRRFGLAGEFAEQLGMTHFMEFRFPKINAGA